LFVVGLFNHVASAQLDDMAPLTKAKNQPVDVSKHLHFRWSEPVCFRQCDGEFFPSSNNKRAGWWAGPAEDIGSILCYQILDVETLKVVNRSEIRTATDPFKQNLRQAF